MFPTPVLVRCGQEDFPRRWEDAFSGMHEKDGGDLPIPPTEEFFVGLLIFGVRRRKFSLCFASEVSKGKDGSDSSEKSGHAVVSA